MEVLNDAASLGKALAAVLRARPRRRRHGRRRERSSPARDDRRTAPSTARRHQAAARSSSSDLSAERQGASSPGRPAGPRRPDRVQQGPRRAGGRARQRGPLRARSTRTGVARSDDVPRTSTQDARSATSGGTGIYCFTFPAGEPRRRPGAANGMSRRRRRHAADRGARRHLRLPGRRATCASSTYDLSSGRAGGPRLPPGPRGRLSRRPGHGRALRPRAPARVSRA